MSEEQKTTPTADTGSSPPGQSVSLRMQVFLGTEPVLEASDAAIWEQTKAVMQHASLDAVERTSRLRELSEKLSHKGFKEIALATTRGSFEVEVLSQVRGYLWVNDGFLATQPYVDSLHVWNYNGRSADETAWMCAHVTRRDDENVAFLPSQGPEAADQQEASFKDCSWVVRALLFDVLKKQCRDSLTEQVKLRWLSSLLNNHE